METKYQLVVEMPNGYRHITAKRDLAHAEKGVEDMVRDQKRSVYYVGAEIYIETREVGKWERLDDSVG